MIGVLFLSCVFHLDTPYNHIYMTSFQNPFIATLNGQSAMRPPVWFMRQAGRVLPNYLKLKANHTFAGLLEDADLAARVTLLPIDDLGVDAAILFSDILVVPQALGMQLDFTDHGPVFGTPLHRAANPLAGLKADASKLEHVYRAIDRIVATRNPNTPLIGFCGAPLTVFCFMFRDNVRDITFKHAIEFLYKERRQAEIILDALTDMSIEYALNQVKHGVDAFQLFETYGGLIPQDLYVDLILPRAARILQAVRGAGVKTIYLPKDLGYGITAITPEMTDFVSIDWHMPLATARQLVHPAIGLQGNLDPRLLYASQLVIEKELEKYLAFGRIHHDWIFNLGHGLLPDIPFENVKFVVDWVKQASWNR